MASGDPSFVQIAAYRAADFARPRPQHDAVQQRLPCERRNFDDARIAQELAEIPSHRCGRRRVRRAEVDEQHADVRNSVVRERRLGAILSGSGVSNRCADDASRRSERDRCAAQSSASSRDSAFDSSLAVTSTIGITRSYAMRVGPMTPSVPITWPFDFVARRHDAAFVERHEPGLAADVDLHALRALRHVEQVQQRRLLLEQVEQPAQPLHVRREVLGVAAGCARR